MATRVAQTIALILVAPVLWAFGLVSLTLVMCANTAQAVRKVWR